MFDIKPHVSCLINYNWCLISVSRIRIISTHVKQKAVAFSVNSVLLRSTDPALSFRVSYFGQNKCCFCWKLVVKGSGDDSGAAFSSWTNEVCLPVWQQPKPGAGRKESVQESGCLYFTSLLKPISEGRVSKLYGMWGKIVNSKPIAGQKKTPRIEQINYPDIFCRSKT